MNPQTEVLYEIARTVSSSLDLGEVLHLIVRSATQIIPDVKASSIRLLDETGQRLQISAAYGLSQAYLNKGPVEVDKSRVDWEALQGRIVSVFDATQDPRVQYPEESRKEGIRSVLCVPLSVKNTVIGVIRTYRPITRLFTDEEVNMLSYLADLGAIAIEHARAYKQLEELEKAKSDLMYTVAHQLKAPLATIQSLVQVILEGYAGSVEPKLASLLGKTARRVRGLIGLVDDLLQLSLASTQIVRPVEEQTDLHEAIRDVIDLLSTRAQKKSVRLIVDLCPGAPTLRIDHEELDHVLTNLIDNAIKYTLKGGHITVRTGETANGLVHVEVADTGIGIAPEEVPRIFEEFYRTKEARRIEHEGTGLGLPIVKRIVERSGGSIHLDSTPGVGSRFNVYLPVRRYVYAGDHKMTTYKMTKYRMTRRVIAYELIGFGLVVCALWIDEVFDTPHHVFGAKATPVNWVESILETALVLALCILVVLSSRRFLSRIKHLEGLLPVCSFCRRIQVGTDWIPLEEYIRDHSSARISHGLCPACAEIS